MKLDFEPITQKNFDFQAKADDTDLTVHECQGCSKKRQIVADGVCFTCYNDTANR